MERSSPLAAMQPPSLSFGPWSCRPEASAPYSSYGYDMSSRYGANFNFNELSMFNAAPADYFSWRPVRGCSPASSLAADLSTNFHIDQSPQLPTPRRALFPANRELGNPFERREPIISPPLPSSSPGPGSECMDVSPLPHKAPFVLERSVLPTPIDICLDTSELDAAEVLEEATPRPQMPPPERRKPSQPRPSLSRTKCLSTTSVNIKPTVECPPFQFGGLNAIKSPTIDTSVQDSMPPPSCDMEQRPQSAGSPPRHPFARPSPPRLTQSTNNLRASGLQYGQAACKAANPLQRPRKQFRRTLSMFEHPQDVMKQEEARFAPAELDPIMDVDDQQQPKLPHFHANDESLPRISKETMVDVLDGKYNQHYSRTVVVDCRFEYEYEGGHIDGAVNHTDKDALARELLASQNEAGKTLLILHCEYSACRAPLMAQHIRGRDRALNAHQYPNLSYPELYILDGGYSSFYSQHKLRCVPQNYVEMGDKKHEAACEKGMGRVKQQRSKLSRAQTFAFGERLDQEMQQASPTGLAFRRPIDAISSHQRYMTATQLDMDLGGGSSLAKSRNPFNNDDLSLGSIIIV